MKVGTRSVLFGVHQFILHPLFVARGWWILYGFPFDPRLWLAFFLHDLGYVGNPNMDGPEGTQHPEWAAKWMGRMFGQEWGDFCRYHSRSLAKLHGKPISRLCVADKMYIPLCPTWLFLFLATLSGELPEYVGDENPLVWVAQQRRHLEKWIEENK